MVGVIGLCSINHKSIVVPEKRWVWNCGIGQLSSRAHLRNDRQWLVFVAHLQYTKLQSAKLM